MDGPPPFPLSAHYHENSNLTPQRTLLLQEQIRAFADSRSEAETAPAPQPNSRTKEYPTRPFLPLPKVRKKLWGARLDEVMKQRRSARAAFQGGAITLHELAGLLELSMGFSKDREFRNYPSAGALYPLEVYAVALACDGAARAIYSYQALEHGLREIAPCPEPAALSQWIYGDELLNTAAIALIFTAVFERTQNKYGERGYRFVLIEAGHAAQNVLLAAASMGLAAVPIGGFCEDLIASGLELPKGESPVYVVLVGCTA